MFVYIDTHIYARIYVPGIGTYHTHTHTGHGLDGSNEIQFFGQNILEASCPWSMYLKRFPNFGLQTRKSSVNIREMSSDKGGERGSERGDDKGSARSSAMTVSEHHENSHGSVDKKNDNKNSNSNETKKYDNSSVTIDNKNITISDPQSEAAKSVKKEMTETKTNSRKHRNLRENSLNLTVTFSETVLERKLLLENTEMEYVSKAESVYTFDNSLDYIHSEVMLFIKF